MRIILLLMSFLSITVSCFSQISWQHFTVYDANIDSTNSVSHFDYVDFADLDNDGDIDVVASAVRAGTWKSSLMWFKNEGDLTFSGPIMLFQSTGQAQLDSYIDVGDIDLDGDIDIAYISSQSNKKVYWFENIENASSFMEHVLTDMFFENCVELKDIDQDGDLDALTAGTRHTEWYENTDGKGDFVRARRFYEYFDGSRHIISGEDFDDDGDFDILYWRANSGTWGTDDFFVHYNVGNDSLFGEAELISSDNPYEIIDIKLLDINQDGQRDIIFSHGKSDGNTFSGVLMWREFKNGQLSNFDNLLATVKGFSSLTLNDLDNDGDIDIISSGGSDDDPWNVGEYIILLNQNNGQFSNPYRLSTNIKKIHQAVVADLNNDGEKELIGITDGGVFGATLDFSPVSNSNLNQLFFDVFPNPTEHTLHLSVSNAVIDYTVEIFSQVGNSHYHSENERQIKLDHLQKGLYFISVTDKNTGATASKKFTKI